MNILYIAYSCNPYFGSENKIGWNIPLKASEKHNVYVLTYIEHKPNIMRYCAENGIDNIKFYYVGLKDIYKKIFRPPFFSGRLNILHKNGYPVAEKICRENNIDVIHQIAPIEFRSIGKYYNIPGVKFICGPIAGGQKVPEGLISYTGKKRRIEKVRSIINSWYRIKIRLSGQLKKCDDILYANLETKDYLEPEKERTVMPETAITEDELCSIAERESKPKNDCFTFLVVSRFVATKGYNLLFDALKRLDGSLNYKINIVGYGPEEAAVKGLFASDENINARTEFLGRLPFSEMKKQYLNADALVFPTFREATGSVILEAMANALPVITINKFGGPIICDESTAYLYGGTKKEDYINSLSDNLSRCINNPEEAYEKGLNARRKAEGFTFTKKLEAFYDIYEKAERQI